MRVCAIISFWCCICGEFSDNALFIWYANNIIIGEEDVVVEVAVVEEVVWVEDSDAAEAEAGEGAGAGGNFLLLVTV